MPVYDDTITDFDVAITAFEAAMKDVAGDNLDAEPDDYAWDICVSVALQCDAETARELCRTQLGAIPREVMVRFPGMRDMEEF
jgi:hypothetical protein